MPVKKKKTSSALSKAQPVKELSLVISALFYGRSGTGKTTLAGTFPNCLFIDIGEKGTDSLQGTDAQVIRANEWDDIEDYYWELHGGNHKFKTVVIDSAHAMQGLAIKEAKIRANKKVTDQTSQKDFGQAGALMIQWMEHYRDLMDLGIHVIFLAHDRVTEVDTDDEDDGMIMPEVGPRLMPSVSSSLLGIVNVVGHTYIREKITKSKKVGEKPSRQVDYCLRIGPHGYYATKIRKPKSVTVPEFLIDPTYDKLVAVIQGKTDSSKPSTTKRRVRRSK